MGRERLKSKSIANVLAFIHDLYTHRNADAFTNHLVSAFSQLGSADVYSYNELNLREHRAVYKYAPQDFTIVPHGMEIFSRFLHQHPHVQYMAKTGDGSPHTISDFMPLRQFKKTDLYQEFYRPTRIPYALVVGVRGGQDASGTALSLGMHRSSQDFCEQDRSVLMAIRPHVLQAFTNAQLVTRLEAQCSSLQHAMAGTPLSLLILTSQHTILWGTPRALELMALCPGWDPRHPDHLPIPVLNWVRCSERDLDMPKELPTPCASLGINCGSHHISLRLVRKGTHRMVILDESSSITTPDKLVALGLSKRETEVLAWVGRGKTNDEIGRILSCSCRTVQKHLERIYVKLGVENRTAAAVVASETIRGY